MKRITVIIAFSFSIFGCSKDMQTVILPPDAVITSGFHIEGKVEDSLRLKVSEIGGINPENCHLGYSSNVDHIIKRNIIRIHSIQCDDQVREFKGLAVGQDTIVGLRINPEDYNILEEDRTFTVMVHETLKLGGLPLNYYSDKSEVVFNPKQI
ncbi:hypothetical protein [Vibrio crassostreae]|uniref:hypothetical protein n=1 Tax=Vibrio crassostreae TaxID=246167 RepID=UPI001B30D8AB|nr:hypothetical protein [Vibrio crassostreae]